MNNRLPLFASTSITTQWDRKRAMRDVLVEQILEEEAVKMTPVKFWVDETNIVLDRASTMGRSTS